MSHNTSEMAKGKCGSLTEGGFWLLRKLWRNKCKTQSQSLEGTEGSRYWIFFHLSLLTGTTQLSFNHVLEGVGMAFV